MSDTLEIINCPACGKPMKKVFIPSQGINLDICLDGCGGIFFDNREFKHFDEQNEDISDIINSIKGKKFEAVDTDKDRICPSCGMKMVKNNSSIKGTIEIDECYNCGGKFLDNDELQKIRAEYATEEDRAEDAMKYLYKSVGAELAEVDERYSKTITNRNLGQKLFHTILHI